MMETVIGERATIDGELKEAIISSLKDEIRQFGFASILVSGGSTPKGLFNLLSNEPLEWSRITVSIVDERFLPNGHADQNAELIKEHLLINEAAIANFIPLVIDPSDPVNNLKLVTTELQKIKRPFTVVVLGMGSDGHTASLFPDSPMLDEAMDLNCQNILLNVRTPSSPYSRITFSRKEILNSKNLYLHCYGQEKKEILNNISASIHQDRYPISGFVNQKENPLNIYWAM